MLCHAPASYQIRLQNASRYTMHGYAGAPGPVDSVSSVRNGMWCPKKFHRRQSLLPPESSPAQRRGRARTLLEGGSPGLMAVRVSTHEKGAYTVGLPLGPVILSANRHPGPGGGDETTRDPPDTSRPVSPSSPLDTGWCPTALCLRTVWGPWWCERPCPARGVLSTARGRSRAGEG